MITRVKKIHIDLNGVVIFSRSLHMTTRYICEIISLQYLRNINDTERPSLLVDFLLCSSFLRAVNFSRCKGDIWRLKVVQVQVFIGIYNDVSFVTRHAFMGNEFEALLDRSQIWLPSSSSNLKSHTAIARFNIHMSQLPLCPSEQVPIHKCCYKGVWDYVIATLTIVTGRCII